jgi:hypothetical protein
MFEEKLYIFTEHSLCFVQYFLKLGDNEKVVGATAIFIICAAWREFVSISST